MKYGFCQFDCKLYHRGCAGNSDGYIKNCKECDPEPQYYLISPQDLEIVYRGDSDSSSEAYEKTRKHPYNPQAERKKVLSLIWCFIEHQSFIRGETDAKTDAIKKYMEELWQSKDVNHEPI